ncbi:hypothetical protein FHG87_008945 [Trinorchestia longiramus]|nr:hypothetical protein FHG87_008945 [Trinorchestia longiramus]
MNLRCWSARCEARDTTAEQRSALQLLERTSPPRPLLRAAAIEDNTLVQLGRLVSESACERKDPGSNPAADIVDAARNTAWDLEWLAIPLETIHKLYESIPRRIEAVIAAKGGPTPY